VLRETIRSVYKDMKIEEGDSVTNLRRGAAKLSKRTIIGRIIRAVI
jgi:hypothetical protein